MRHKKGSLVRFGVSIDEDLLKDFNSLIDRKGYANRSEAIRDLIRNQLVETEWADKDKETVGVIRLVYNHEIRELVSKLVNSQHHHYMAVISSLHVHLDESNCLEVIIVKGRGKKVIEIADNLISSKGVKHGRLAMTTTGKNIS